MYVFFDDDEFSLTKNCYSVRVGSMSYDGFNSLIEALSFMYNLERV